MQNSLSHALHPPLDTSFFDAQPPSATTNDQRQEEEEDDDEEVVEEELNNHSPRPSSSALPSKSGGASSAPMTDPKSTLPTTSQPDADGKIKRGPGRPRGSKTSKTAKSKIAPSTHSFFQYPPPPGGSQSAGLHPQHQQYYEFQWRALNLCSEFYNAAEELVKGTPPMVIAQCYQMGPGAKLDPLGMISEAKRICDNILANPSQLVNNPPPAVYSSYTAQLGYGSTPYPTQYPAQPYQAPTYTHPTYAVQSSPSASDNGSTGVISNPQSFVMPLGPSTMGPPSSYMYQPRYPTTSYYHQYPSGSTSYYPPNTQSAAPTSTPVANVPSPSWPTGYNQGAWSEEEQDRLKQLTEQSKEQNSGPHKGEIDWDWVITTWGNTRTRHQILLKATSLGLKESTTRGNKRRRGDTDPDSNGPTNPSSTEDASASTTLPTTAPESMHSSPEPGPASTSPAMSALQQSMQPKSSATTSPPTANSSTTVQWALPTTAQNPPQNDRSYYRQRPTSYSSTSSKAGVQHQFMYAPNSAGSV